VLRVRAPAAIVESERAMTLSAKTDAAHKLSPHHSLYIRENVLYIREGLLLVCVADSHKRGILRLLTYQDIQGLDEGGNGRNEDLLDVGNPLVHVML